MPDQPSRELCYLLRLWPTQEEGESVWRASLENVHGGQRLGFATLARLAAFLADQTAGLVEEQRTDERRTKSATKRLPNE